MTMTSLPANHIPEGMAVMSSQAAKAGHEAQAAKEAQGAARASQDNPKTDAQGELAKVQQEYTSKTGKSLPPRFKNNIEWLKSKI